MVEVWLVDHHDARIYCGKPRKKVSPVYYGGMVVVTVSPLGGLILQFLVDYVVLRIIECFIDPCQNLMNWFQVRWFNLEWWCLRRQITPVGTASMLEV